MTARRLAPVVAAASLLAAACGGGGLPSVELVASDLQRVAPRAPATDVAVVAAGSNAFAAAAYPLLADETQGNLVFSPASVHLVLAMIYAGARGQTAAEMAEVLHFDLEGVSLHSAFNTLDQELGSRNRVEPSNNGVEPRVRLSIANSLWGQEGYEFVPGFLDTLAENYGTGMRLVDFTHATEAAREAINQWVADQTEDRITDLILEGVLTQVTRLVLTNAIYLDATWAEIFESDHTAEAPFYPLGGSEVLAPMMHREGFLPYATGDGWQAVELPYTGDELAMLFLIPGPGGFTEVEGLVAGGLLDQVVGGLAGTHVRPALPRFEARTRASLGPLLSAMGMPTAFSPGADFSGMTAEERLCIGEVLHEAFIKVDEEGTEAAAATAVIQIPTAITMPIDWVVLRIDHPFLFSLYDRETGEVLFLGRVLNPAEQPSG